MIDFIKENFGKFYANPRDIGSQGILEGTKYAGRKTNLRTQAYILVKMLKAKHCLEIGSWHYLSSNAMGQAQDEIGLSDGWVDSFDLQRGGYDGANVGPGHPRVRAHFWLPHHTQQDTWKYDRDIPHKEFKSMTDEQIFETNLNYLKSIMPENRYDLILVDGDHSYKGIEWDWKYCEHLARPDTVLIIDDIWDSRLIPCREFFDWIPTAKWDFESWNDTPGNEDKCQNSGVAMRF